MYFIFCFCFFAWYSSRNYEFRNRLKICAIAAGIKKYESIITKTKKKHNKIIFLANSKLHSIEVLIFNTVIDLNISHDDFFLINNVPKEYDDMKKEIKYLKT